MPAASGSRLARVGLGVLAALAVVAVAAPLLAPYDPVALAGPAFARPSLTHLLGTNDVGQDLFSQLLFGARSSLGIGLAAGVVGVALGTAVGLVAGYAGGWPDRVLARIVDAVLTLPFVPLAIVVAAFLGGSVGTEVAVIVAVVWAAPARILRSQVLVSRTRGHVEAARAMGAGTPYVLRRHVLPAVLPLVVTQLVRAASAAILLEAALSFLGLGSLTRPSWGTILAYANARSAFLTDAWPWWVLPPGVAIAATVVALAFVGFGLEERADPRQRVPFVAAAALPTASSPVVAAGSDGSVLDVRRLTIAYPGPSDASRPVIAVDRVSLRIAPGEVVALVGQSGSGKTSLATALLGLVRPPGRIVDGRVVVAGRDLAGLSDGELRAVRGGPIGFVPQNAMNALDPVHRVIDQVAETIRAHRRVTRAAAHDEAVTVLGRVGIPADRATAHPHALSGGMRQRCVIAMALCNGPALLIADEPTSGLDARTQASIVDLLAAFRDTSGLAILLITHDVSLALRLADRLAVMRRGRLIEELTVMRTPEPIVSPRIGYSRWLLDSARAPGPAAVRP